MNKSNTMSADDTNSSGCVVEKEDVVISRTRDVMDDE